VGPLGQYWRPTQLLFFSIFIFFFLCLTFFYIFQFMDIFKQKSATYADKARCEKLGGRLVTQPVAKLDLSRPKEHHLVGRAVCSRPVAAFLRQASPLISAKIGGGRI
jgi:hypothetical protein